MQLNHETFQSKRFMFYSYLILFETLEHSKAFKMYGLVMENFTRYLVHKYGEDSWDNIRRLCNVDTATFSVHQVRNLLWNCYFLNHELVRK